MPLDRREALAELGLPPSADVAAVKRAYRRLVRDHHPDVGGDPAAFQRLQGAYEALADHAPSPAPEVRRGTPSRPRAAWSAEAAGRTPGTDPAAIPWDAPAPGAGARLDGVGLAVRLARTDAGEPVTATTATSRAPGSRLNRVAASLSPDLTATLRVAPTRDDRGAAVICTELRAGTRRARRRLDDVALDGGWVRTRGSASTTLRATVAPDPDPRRTALRVVEPLEDLLARLDWPLAAWTLTDGDTAA